MGGFSMANWQCHNQMVDHVKQHLKQDSCIDGGLPSGESNEVLMIFMTCEVKLRSYNLSIDDTYVKTGTP